MDDFSPMILKLLSTLHAAESVSEHLESIMRGVKPHAGPPDVTLECTYHFSGLS